LFTGVFCCPLYVSSYADYMSFDDTLATGLVVSSFALLGLGIGVLMYIKKLSSATLKLSEGSVEDLPAHIDDVTSHMAQMNYWVQRPIGIASILLTVFCLVVILILLLAGGASHTKQEPIAVTGSYAIGAASAIVFYALALLILNSGRVLAVSNAALRHLEGESEPLTKLLRGFFAQSLGLLLVIVALDVISFLVVFLIARRCTTGIHWGLSAISACALGRLAFSICITAHHGVHGGAVQLTHPPNSTEEIDKSSGGLQCVGVECLENLQFVPSILSMTEIHIALITIFESAIQGPGWAVLFTPMAVIVTATAVTFVGVSIMCAVTFGDTLSVVPRILQTGLIISIVAVGLSYGLMDLLLGTSEATTLFGGLAITTTAWRLWLHVAFGALIVTVVGFIHSRVAEPLGRIASYASRISRGSIPITFLIAFAVANVMLFVTALIITAFVYTAYRRDGLLGLVFLSTGSMIPSLFMFVLGGFGPAATTTKILSAACVLPPNPLQLARYVAEKSSVVRSIAHSSLNAPPFLCTVTLMCAFVKQLKLHLNLFDPHVFIFIVIGAATCYICSAAILSGMVSTAIQLRPSRHINSYRPNMSQRNTSTSQRPGEGSDGDERAGLVQRPVSFSTTTTTAVIVSEDVVAPSKKVLFITSVGLVAFAAVPGLVTLFFGLHALVGYTLGLVMGSFSTTVLITTLGTVAEAIQATQAKHDPASVAVVAICLPLRAAYGPRILGLTKIIAAICLVIIPVFQFHRGGYL